VTGIRYTHYLKNFWIMNNPLLNIVVNQKSGKSIGIYSVCSANKFVLEAAMRQAKVDNSSVLIEATCNQVNQYGGYTGMTPEQFIVYLKEIAKKVNLPFDRVILGGDHLGPNVWQSEDAEIAMKKACDLVYSYVKAGFTKIHLDASMRCGTDPGDENSPLDESIIAERTVRLCKTAESAYSQNQMGAQAPLYIIGTEVPIPGGSQEEMEGLHITTVESARRTIELTREKFLLNGLETAWKRVIGLVVQPGVEFGDSDVVDYSHEKAIKLSKLIEEYSNLIFEAHSTDYQMKESLRQMVKDHFAILKVGPSLTFAFREAVFALERMEIEWLSNKKSIKMSGIQEVLDKTMKNKSDDWRKHYHGDEFYQSFARKYSYSDRLRYYWPDPAVTEALNRLLANVSNNPPPLSLLSQYLPTQYQAVRESLIQNEPRELIYHKICEVLKIYAYATGMDRQFGEN